MPELDLSVLMYGLAVGIGAGLLGGLMAGLAGVGGGLVYVPVFYALMPTQSGAMSTYIFASLVAIIITGFFSSRSHWRLGHVNPICMRALLPGLIIGAGLGLWSTLHVPGTWILFALAALNAWVAFDYSHSFKSSHQSNTKLSLLSGPIGFISGLLGIGGGTMLVPLLRRSLALRQAVGTSAVCGLGMALGAVSMNVILEANWSYVLGDQWTFLCAAWLGLVIILPQSISWSAQLHERIAESTLRIMLKTMYIGLSIVFCIAALAA